MAKEKYPSDKNTFYSVTEVADAAFEAASRAGVRVLWTARQRANRFMWNIAVESGDRQTVIELHEASMHQLQERMTAFREKG